MATRTSRKKSEQIRQEKSNIPVELLLDSSPNAVILSDPSGYITQFNKQARAILDYPEEYDFPSHVHEVYYEEGEAQEIGQELAKNRGILKDRLTSFRSQSGERILVRLSAITFYNEAQGQRQGTVGYFEDMRSFRTLENRVQLLSRISLMMAQNENLKEGLSRLAELVVSFLSHTFCRVLLLDERGSLFVVKAAEARDYSAGPFSWAPQLGQRLDPSEAFGSSVVWDMKEAQTLSWHDLRQQDVLRNLSSRLELQQSAQSLLRVPLRLRGKLLGFLEIGEIEGDERHPISVEEKTLASGIAAQASIFIERLQQHELVRRRNDLLGKLEEKLQELRPEMGEARLLNLIARLASGLVHSVSAGVYFNFRNAQKIRLRAVDGPFLEKVGTEHGYNDSVVGQVTKTKRWAAAPAILLKREAKDPVAVAVEIPLPLSNEETKEIELLAVGIPLKHFGEVEYILVVTYTKGAPEFLDADLEVLQLFADRASLALATAQALKPEQRMRAFAPLLLKLRDYIQSTQDIKKIIHATLTVMTAGYGLSFNRAAFFLLDAQRKNLLGQIGIGHLEETVARSDWEEQSFHKAGNFDHYIQSLEAGTLGLTPVGAVIQGLSLSFPYASNDLCAHTIESGQPHLTAVSQPYSLPHPLVQALAPSADAIVLPLKARAQVLGVVFADKKFLNEAISQEEVDLLMSVANAAATAIENLQLLKESVRRAENLEKMRRAAEELAAGPDSQDTMLQQIVKTAKTAFDADFVALQLYDTNRQKFVQPVAKKENIDDKLWMRVQEMESEWRQGARAILEQGGLNVPDVDDPSYRKIWPELVHQWIEKIGARSFQCIVLAVGEEKLGILFVNYVNQRIFSKEDNELARTFGTHAAFALKKVQLLEQFRKVKHTAESIARAMTLGNLDQTLDAITQGIREALGCDAVTLWTHDQDTDTIHSPPRMAGVLLPDKVQRQGREPKGTVVWRMLEKEEPYVVEDITIDPYLKDTRFAREERIRSCIAISLKVAGRKMGVLFVNYRHLRQFSTDELAGIRHFADQAAVAIYTAQLYYQADGRAQALQTLYDAGQAISGSLDTQEILKTIGEQAWRLLDHAGRRAGECDVWQFSDGIARFIYVHPPFEEETLAFREMLVPLLGTERKGIIGRAILTREPQLVGNVQDDEDYRLFRLETRSELAVPIIVNEQVVAVINLEHPQIDEFSLEDVRTLEALALQASIAIHKARQYEELEKTKNQLAAKTAVAWMGMASATWRHAIRNDATTIHDIVDLLRFDLEYEPTEEKIRSRFDSIKRLAKKIQDAPITAPLSTHEGTQLIAISDFLRERVNQLQRNQSVVETHKGVSFHYRSSSDALYFVRGNPYWLTQAFGLLVDNAVKAMVASTSKEIVVMTQSSRGGVKITLADTGKGILPEVQKLLLHGPIPENLHPNGSGGSGMGVLLAQTIVQTYGGDLSIEATGPTGTTMAIWLPLSGKEYEEKPISTSGSVLFVGSSKEKTESVALLAEVLAPFSGLYVIPEEDALEHVSHEDYEIVLLDSPSISDPTTLIRCIRERQPAIKIFVVASAPDWKVARECLRLGATDYIDKSASLNELKSTFARLFTHRREAIVSVSGHTITPKEKNDAKPRRFHA